MLALPQLGSEVGDTYDGRPAGMPTETQDNTRPAATPRRTIPRPISLAVFAVFAAVSVATFVVTRRVIDDQEHRLLVQRHAEVATLANTTIGGAQTSLRILAGIGASTDPKDTLLYERNATPLLTGTTVTVATVVPDAAGQFTVASAVGPGASIGDVLTGERAMLATRALDEGQLVATQFAEGDGERLVIAVPAFGGTRAVAVQESIMPSAAIRSVPGSPFGDLRVMLYTSTEADPATVLLTTEGQGQTITGGVHEVLPIGAERWLSSSVPATHLSASSPRTCRGSCLY